MSSDTNCSFLYLPPPTGLSRDESYIYHLATRNFFAWLLGVPLVGTDPVSALLDLKLRMDMWRDPGSGNFGALFDYVKEQGYGDFEALEIEMGKRLNADMNQANRTSSFPPTNPMIFSDQSRPRDEGKTSRRNSLTQRIKRRLSRSRVRDEEQTGPVTPGPNHIEARVQTLRMNSYNQGPQPPSADHISAAMERLVGPSSTQSVDIIPNVTSGNEEKMKKRRSWANIAGNAWKRKSMTDVRLPPLQMQQLQPGEFTAVERPNTSALTYAQALPSEPTSAVVEKKKRRLSWKRASMTDIKLDPLQNQEPQPAISSSTNRPPSAPASAPAPESTHPLQSASRSTSVSPEEKKKRRLSWANVSDKIFDMMMPPASKDNLEPPVSTSEEGDSSAAGKPSEPSATGTAAAPPFSPAASVAAPIAQPISSTSAGGSATGSSSRPPPGIHDFSTGSDLCACCGKLRLPLTQSAAGPSRVGTSQPISTGMKDVEEAKDKRGTFETLHDHMKSRRDRFRSRSHKEIIIPDYGNGAQGQTVDSGKGKTRSTDQIISAVGVRLERKGRSSDARRLKTRSIDAVISPVEVRRTEVGRPKTQPVGKIPSVNAIVAPTEARTKELRRLNTQPLNAVPSMNVQHEMFSVVPAGPMLASELVATPTSVPGLSASSSTPDTSSLRAYRRSSRPASMEYGQRVSATGSPTVVLADSGRGGVNDIKDVHHQVTTTREPATSHLYGSGKAQPMTESLSHKQGLDDEKFRVVDADFESNIEDLLAQLEAAGISETKTEKGKDNHKSLSNLEPTVGMPRLVYEVA